MRKDVHKNRGLLILTIVFVTLFASPVSRSGSPLDECPTLTIECPAEVPEAGKTYAVTLRVEGGNPNQELTYGWTVSSGEIVEGQGTSRLKVLISEPEKSVTATVEVGGINPDCTRVASCSFAVTSK